MSMRIGVGVVLSAVAFVGMSCGAEDVNQGDELGTLSEGVTKCQNVERTGDSNYCADPACPCVQGEGDCDSDSECSGGAVCVRSVGLQFGFNRAIDVCAASHCRNSVLDGDETQIDCGGSCGSICGDPCADNPPNGQNGHCTADCQCPALEADCNVDSECQSGLICRHNEGNLYGYPEGMDVCVGAHCLNGIRDGDETGTDCGGSCKACSAGEVGDGAWGGAGNDRATSIAFDGSGNFVVAGRFADTANFGGDDLTSAGFADVFVAKYSPTGAHVWSKRFGGANADGDNGVSVATDAFGNVFVAGNYYLTVNFGGSDLTAVDGSDIFLVKLDPNGNHVWSKSYGGVGIDRVGGIATDPSNNVVLAGAFQNSISFGGPSLTSTTAGTYDVVVARISASGGHLFSRRYGSTGNDLARDVMVDALKGPVVVGSFEGTVDFGLGAVASLGVSDGFVIRLSSAGATTWAKTVGGTGADQVNAVAVDANRRPVAVGSYRSSVDFGNGIPAVSAGSTDVFAVAYDQLGTYRWHAVAGGSGADHPNGIAIDSVGNVAVVGHFQASVDFGTGALTSNGLDDIFIARYDSAGAIAWSASAGDTGSDSAQGADQRNGVLVVTGWFLGSIDLGNGPLTNAGGADVFVSRGGF